MTFKFKWERISDEDDCFNTFRAKVVGGWIVQSYQRTPKESAGLTSVFIPDLTHEWRV